MAGMRYQPQGGHRVDQSNAIGRGLALAFHGGSALREVVGGAVATSRGSAQSVKGFPGGLAYDLRAVNTAAFFSAVRVAQQLLSDQSVVFDLVISGAPSGSIPALGGMWRSTTQNDTWLVVERDTADTLQVNFRIAGGYGTRTFNIGASALYGRRLIIAASITRGPTGSGTVYLRVAADGAIIYDLSQTFTGTTGVSADVTPTGTEYISIGSESIENGSRNCNAIQYGQYHLGRAVSAAEVASLSTQPWQMFAAPSEDDESVVAGGGTINSYTLTAAAGSFSLAGSAAFLRVSRALPAAAGSFALNGAPAALRAARRLPADAGSFAMAGWPTGLAASRRLAAASGAFAFAGTATGLIASRRLPAAPGAFALTGASMQLVYQPVQVPDGGPAQYTLTAAPGSFGLTGAAVTMRAHRRLAAEQGAFSLSSTAAAIIYGALTPPGSTLDVSQISIERIVLFDGSGSRVVVFEGSGSRVVIFEGSGTRVRFDQMSAKVPVKVGDKWTVDRDPDEISYYAADITQELLDRNTTAGPGDVVPVLFGVELIEGPELQVATVDGVERTFVVVKLGGVDGELPGDWRWVARVPCVNGERFDKTTWFNKVDP